jgi:N-acetylneuraminic acid mutarotase
MQRHLIIYGGITRTDSGENIHVADLWSYDLQQSRWQQIMPNSSLAGGPGGLAAHTATVVDQMPDKMIVFGGSIDQGEAKSDITWIYSFIQQTWRRVDTSLCPGKRDFHTAVAIPASSKLKMWGGIDDKTVWSFDATMEVWSQASPGLDYESGRSGSYFHGMLFSFGGFAMESGNLIYSNSLQWQTDDGKWMEATIAGSNLPKGRCYAVFATVGEGLYMFGGFHRTISPADPQRLSDLWQVSVQQDIVMPAETARRSPLELPSWLSPKANLQVGQTNHNGSDVLTYYV